MSLTLEVIDRSVQGKNHSMAIALEFDWEAGKGAANAAFD